MGAHKHGIFGATPVDLLHGFCSGLFKNVLSITMSILMKIYGIVVFETIEERMSRMPRFPSVAGYSNVRFPNGTMLIIVFVLHQTGLSRFIDSPENISSMQSGNSSLGCGIGMHSKDYATLLVQLGMCLQTHLNLPIYSFLTDSTLRSTHPQHLIRQSILAVVSVYMEIRRAV